MNHTRQSPIGIDMIIIDQCDVTSPENPSCPRRIQAEKSGYQPTLEWLTREAYELTQTKNKALFGV
jgi:hypothetical protein